MNVPLMCSVVTLLFSAKGLGAKEDSWSVNVQAEVRAVEGYAVVLPCSFSHPQHSLHSSLDVLWRLGHGQGSTIVFHCTIRPGDPICETGPQQDQRYRLEGDPRVHDLSLRINSAALQDSGRYYCRVEVQGRQHGGFEAKTGTRVRVEAPPKISSLSVEGGEQSGYRALCQVQGSPLPDVLWIGPDDLLDGSLVRALPQDSTPDHHHTVSQLTDVEPGQQYTCSASNPLGREEATLYVLPPRPPPLSATPPPLVLLLSLSLGSKVILLVVMGLWMVQGAGALRPISCWWK